MRRALLACGLVVSLASCGGGSSGGGEVTVVLKPLTGLAGAVDSVGTVDTASAVVVGDDLADHGWRIVQAFSLAAIPEGAEILSAVYQNEQLEVVGAPYDTLGIVQMTSTDIGASLGGEDYAPLIFSLIYGTLSGDASLGVKTLDVTDGMRGQIDAGLTDRFDIRLSFTTEEDSDGSFDQAVLYGPARAGDVPGIVVRYRE